MFSCDNPTLALNNNKALIISMYCNIRVHELTFTLQSSSLTANQCFWKCVCLWVYEWWVCVCLHAYFFSFSHSPVFFLCPCLCCCRHSDVSESLFLWQCVWAPWSSRWMIVILNRAPAASPHHLHLRDHWFPVLSWLLCAPLKKLPSGFAWLYSFCI